MNDAKYINGLVRRYPELDCVTADICEALGKMLECYRTGGKLLICGNGGSAADSEHISGELLKGFMSKREPEGEELEKLTAALGESAKKLQRGISAIPLTSLTSALSAFANDVEPELVFAQLTYALGKPGDVLICISTSGSSKNVVAAARVARELGITTVALTGKDGGALGTICDVTIAAPATETYRVQEYHLPIYHAICAEFEKMLFQK